MVRPAPRAVSTTSFDRSVVVACTAFATLLVTSDANASAVAGVGTTRDAGIAPSPMSLVSEVAPMSIDLADGRLEVRRFAIQGIPLRGAFEVVHTSRTDGVARVVASRRPTAEAALRGPTIDSARAAAAAMTIAAAPRSSTAPPLPVEPERPPELVYRMVLGTPVLAWEVLMPLTTDPEPTRKTLWISAASGELLDEREKVFASRARIYAENPSTTPDPIVVELTDLVVDGAGLPLAGPRVSSFNCTLEEPAEPQPWHDDGDCWAVARALSDDDGNYFVPVPDPIDAATGLDGDDLYAELSMYAHAERFLNVMADRGVTQFRCEHSTMLANFRTLSDDEPPELEPLDNAYYTDQCDPEKGPTMIFGQGSAVDFAFDGDVIYHELGHGIVALLAPEGLGVSRPRGDAVLADAGAINEAIADYVSVMLQDDPDLAEYVGRFWPEMTTPYIRTATNEMRCPDDTIGQVHNDGEPLMAALWSVRTEIGAALDPVVLGALARLPEDASLEEASAALLAVAGERESSGALAAGGVGLLDRALVARGLVDCPRVITDPESVAEGRTMWLRRKNLAVEPFWPGPMQMRFVVPDDARSMTVTFELRGRSNDEPPTASVLVKRSPLPIAFTYDLVARDDLGDPTGGSEKIREVTLVGGDWDLQVPAVRVAGREHEVRIDGLLPGEVVHLSLVGTSGVDSIAELVRVVDDRDYDAGASSSSGGDVPEGDAREDVRPGDATASCACRTNDTPGFSLGWLCLVVLVRRRP